MSAEVTPQVAPPVTPPVTPPVVPAGAPTPPVAPPPKPFYDGFYGPDGKIDKTALDRLPDHLKPHKDLFAKYETVDAMLNGFGNAHSMAVKKALAPLTGNEPPEIVAERKAHLDTLNNVPKDIKGYGIKRPDDLPEMFWYEEEAQKFGQIAQKHSLSPAAVKELLDLQLGTTRASIAKGQQMEQEFYAKQDSAYNAAVQKMGMDPEKAKNLSERGAYTLGIDVKDPIWKNAQVRLAALRAANLVSEDKLITGDPTQIDVGNERDMARDIMSNPQNPLHRAWSDANDPRHEQAKERVNELYRIHGERQARSGR